MKIGWRGAVTEAEQAVIPVYDHGFLYGMGLFETFRTYSGYPYLLDWHLQRLAEGCRAVGIRYTPDAKALCRLLDELMEANRLQEAYVRLTITAGEGELGLPAGDYTSPSEFIMVKALPVQAPSLYEAGRELALLRHRRNTPEGDIRLKSLHYMNNILAKRELLASGAAPGAEGLMLTREGWLAEGIVSNLFFIAGGRICTPDVGTGILPGITRRKVIELAQTAGYPVEEGHYPWSALLEADEIWLTNSIQELVPVTTLRHADGAVTRVGDGRAGRMTAELLTAYRADALRACQG